jgi:hypothetical protein
MKIDSIKLHIQDLPDKKGKLFAAVSGKVTLNTGEVKLDEKLEVVLDENGDEIPILEDINMMFALNKDPSFAANIQAIAMEALTLKNLEIAEENGQISHFVQAVGAPEKKKGLRITKPKVKRKKKV